MDAFYERLAVRAATIDEVLSDDFEPLPGQKDDTDLAAKRLAAWCRSATGGDAALFSRRLERDGLATGQVLTKFANIRRKISAAPPAWIGDAIWIGQALQSPDTNWVAAPDHVEPCAFEHLLVPVVDRAEVRLWQGVKAPAIEHLAQSARASLRISLLKELSGLCAPALYERFARERKARPQQGNGTSFYDQFVAEMKAGGWRRLFEDKPVLLRLMATLTRQWIDASREFVLRLDADLPAIRRDLLPASAQSRVARIDGDFADPHNDGRSVRVVSFTDGSRVVYKPKDLRLDIAWRAMIERLNEADPPVTLKAVRAIACDGYGWTEFITHDATDPDGCRRFFRRAGAWLALFHCFAAADMHQENMIASADQPVPIDLETMLHAAALPSAPEPEEEAFDAARDLLANSVMSTGLLPAYGRSPFNNVFAIGGLTSGWTAKTTIAWTNINTDAMRPTRAKEGGESNPNLPFVAGVYARFTDYIDDFVEGFENYAKFLARRTNDKKFASLFNGFSGVPVRKVIRPTRFYYMLLQRLKNHQTMDDGVTWSAQADFIARLAEWDKELDPLWPLQRAERSALLSLNVPHFVSLSDGDDIRDKGGVSVHTQAKSGLERARARVQSLDEREIAWQVEVIRENTASNLKSPATAKTKLSDVAVAPAKEIFTAEAGRIAGELFGHAIRRGPGAAWIGLDWLGDSDVFQLIALGADLYNGASGIALFLAAHAAATGTQSSAELAIAGIVNLRKNLTSRSAARWARSLGLGGGVGLGGIVYALTVISKCLHDDVLLVDAHAAAGLFTDELIAADKQLDVIGGAAGAILCLLRLHRDSQSEEALRRAEKCGEHLMAQSRLGTEGRRSWVGQGLGMQALNGMSHGAAGFAYALASLAQVTGRDDFAQAASECVAYEDSNYDAARNNWPDLRATGEPSWPCQWCHGAPGIGLARIAMAKRNALNAELMASDIRNAVEGVQRGWPGAVDTLCCGTLGSVEFLCEAGDALGRGDLRDLAARRLMAVLQGAAAAGDYRWNNGQRRFNLGLFRGLAGVGYTALRQADASLPNVLIWE